MQLGQHSKNIEKDMNIICFSVFLGGGGLQVGGLGTILAPSWRSWDHLGSKLEDLGPSWLQVGRSWGHLGSNLEVLGPSWLQVGRSWRHLGSKLRVQSESIEKPLVFQGSGSGRESRQYARVMVKLLFGVAHYSIQSGLDRIQDTRYNIQDTGYRIHAGYRIQE